MFDNGKEFMDYLHEGYGLLEGYSMAEEYLRISREIAHNTDPAEVKFCAELEEAMRKLDMI